MIEWLDIAEHVPIKGNIILVWLERLNEPCVVQVNRDEHGPVYYELVKIDIFDKSRDNNKFKWWAILLPPKDKEFNLNEDI